MKARNNFERRIEGLVEKLKPLTAKEEAVAISRMFKGVIKVKSKTTHVCAECGHVYGSSKNRGTEVCPNCGRRGELVRKMPGAESKYFAILEKVEDLQVIRYFEVTRRCSHGLTHTGIAIEVAQNWIDDKGKRAIRALPKRTNFSSYYIGWGYGNELSFKTLRNSMYSYIKDDFDYVTDYVKVRSLIPYFKRYGYKQNFKTVYTTLYYLLNHPHHATLYETGQIDAFGRLSDYDLSTIKYKSVNGQIVSLWQIIKLCTRHGYIIKDFVTWRDMIQMISDKHCDLLSPKYVCMSDKEVKREHDRLVRQRHRQERMATIAKGEGLMKRKEDLKFLNREYKRMHKKYLGILIESKGITIKPLQTIEEFYEEGTSLHHCVFTNRYYERQNSIILSARRGETRLATIEVSKCPFRILQCYADYDSIPKENKKIRNIIERNEKLFHVKEDAV